MAKNAYVGVNNVAQKIKAMYVGVNGVARKITKGYVGVNGVAQQFYATETLIPFTSSVAPTSWSGTSAAANASFTASNTYGSWRAVTSAASIGGYVGKLAFDGDTYTEYSLATAGADTNVYLYLPTGIEIKPSKMSVVYANCGTACVVYGYKNGSWVSLKSGWATKQYSKKTTTIQITTNDYYSAFRVYFKHGYSSQYVKVYDVEVAEGTIKDSR